MIPWECRMRVRRALSRWPATELGIRPWGLEMEAGRKSEDLLPLLIFSMFTFLTPPRALTTNLLDRQLVKISSILWVFSPFHCRFPLLYKFFSFTRCPLFTIGLTS